MSDTESDPETEEFEAESDLKLEDFDKPGDTPDELVAPEAPPASVADDEDAKGASSLAPLFDVPVRISAVLGKTKINVNDLLALNQGSVLELDRKVGEAIDIYVNNRIVARGEVVIVDEQLGVTMTEIVKGGDGAT